MSDAGTIAERIAIRVAERVVLDGADADRDGDGDTDTDAGPDRAADPHARAHVGTDRASESVVTLTEPPGGAPGAASAADHFGNGPVPLPASTDAAATSDVIAASASADASERMRANLAISGPPALGPRGLDDRGGGMVGSPHGKVKYS